jgi:AraC-like DNA-binding protein
MTMPTERGLKEIVFNAREDAEHHIASIASSISAVDYEDEGFHLSYAGGSIGHCALHRGATSTMRYAVSDSDEYHFVVLQGGSMRYSGRRADVDAIAQRNALLLGPTANGLCKVAGDSTGISMIVTGASIRAYATRVLGDDAGIELAGPDARSLDLGDPITATLSRNVTGVFHELQALGRSGLSKLALAHFDEILLGIAAVAVSPRIAASMREAPQQTGSQAVRKAREFLHAHAAEPVSLSELASRIGVGLRSLQIAFRREIGCSPREYLIACRLEVARARLLSASDGTTVTQIALECGFTDLAVFARRYREQFGEKPSDTLRRR